MRIYKINNKEDIEYWSDVTQIVKDIFGGIVKAAKILLVIDYGLSKYNYEEMAENELVKIEKHYKKMGILQTDATDLVITFINGETVKFTNSEWGSLRKYDIGG